MMTGEHCADQRVEHGMIGLAATAAANLCGQSSNVIPLGHGARPAICWRWSQVVRLGKASHGAGDHGWPGVPKRCGMWTNATACDDIHRAKFHLTGFFRCRARSAGAASLEHEVERQIGAAHDIYLIPAGYIFYHFTDLWCIDHIMAEGLTPAFNDDGTRPVRAAELVVDSVTDEVFGGDQAAAFSWRSRFQFQGSRSSMRLAACDRWAYR
jgi:hypothetical protein